MDNHCLDCGVAIDRRAMRCRHCAGLEAGSRQHSRQAKSISMKRLYSDPSYRSRHAERMRNPETIVKLRNAAKAQWADPLQRAMQITKLQSPQVRLASKIARHRYFSNPKMREIWRERTTNLWQDPIYLAKIRLGQQKRCANPAFIQKMKNLSGPNNVMKRPEVQAKHQQALLKKWQDPEVQEKHRGSRNGAWLGGISFEPYGQEFDWRCKRTIRDRDGHACKHCGQPENGRKLCVHHVDYCKTNNDPGNLVSLCLNCHAATNNNRPYWMQYYQEMMRPA